jgi:hypothetical protein
MLILNKCVESDMVEVYVEVRLPATLIRVFWM